MNTKTYMYVELPETLANYLEENRYSAYIVASVGELLSAIGEEELMSALAFYEIVDMAQDLLDANNELTNIAATTLFEDRN
jgi:hypothetical protein